MSGVLTDSSGTKQATLSASSFTLAVPAGGAVFLSASALNPGDPTTVGWARLESAGALLTAVATYEFVVGGSVQRMVGVLQSQPLRFATVPVNNDDTQAEQMAYAIANPTDQAVSIKLALVGQDGNVVDDTVTVTLSPGQQVARYLWQDLARSTNFKGSFVLRGQNGATFVAVALADKQGLLTVVPLIAGKAPAVPN